ncbi:hypothetical protein J6590_054791 [Homalodisca vitripennis]|nr:hypothetical protein J6590_054791 [Homalodisca vitripennis]
MKRRDGVSESEDAARLTLGGLRHESRSSTAKKEVGRTSLGRECYLGRARGNSPATDHRRNVPPPPVARASMSLLLGANARVVSILPTSHIDHPCLTAASLTPTAGRPRVIQTSPAQQRSPGDSPATTEVMNKTRQSPGTCRLNYFTVCSRVIDGAASRSCDNLASGNRWRSGCW